MPVPDPHANEPKKEVDREIVKLFQEAKSILQFWTDRTNELKAKLQQELGDAYAGTVDGKTVLTYRPQQKYAQAALIRDYPDLTEHFIEPRMVYDLDVDRFAEQHPEIADKYRIRSFREVQ